MKVLLLVASVEAPVVAVREEVAAEEPDPMAAIVEREEMAVPVVPVVAMTVLR